MIKKGPHSVVKQIKMVGLWGLLSSLFWIWLQSDIELMLTISVRHTIFSWEPVKDRILGTKFRPKMENILIGLCYVPINTFDARRKRFSMSKCKLSKRDSLKVSLHSWWMMTLIPSDENHQQFWGLRLSVAVEASPFVLHCLSAEL